MWGVTALWGEAMDQRRNACAWLDRFAITVPSGEVPQTETTAFVTPSPEHKCHLCHTKFK